MSSDMEWYIKQSSDPRRNKFYGIFFDVCRKFNISWADATEKEKALVEEITRLEFEKSELIECGSSR